MKNPYFTYKWIQDRKAKVPTERTGYRTRCPLVVSPIEREVSYVEPPPSAPQSVRSLRFIGAGSCYHWDNLTRRDGRTTATSAREGQRPHDQVSSGHGGISPLTAHSNTIRHVRAFVGIRLQLGSAIEESVTIGDRHRPDRNSRSQGWGFSHCSWQRRSALVRAPIN